VADKVIALFGPTASGKSVQLRWEPDTGDAVVREALGLLRKIGDTASKGSPHGNGGPYDT